MRDTFAAALGAWAEQDERIMFLTADLGFGVFEGFKARFPKQYMNVGVAEQNMIAVATGLALEDYIVFVYSIANFPVLRCLEQIRNDAAYHSANVKVVSIGGGFSYGPLGMSHHATEDIAIMRAIPEVACFTPGTLRDVESSVEALITTDGTGYLRLDKSSGAETPDATPFIPGSWRTMSPGDDVALVACGGVLAEAQAAAELLRNEGAEARVVNATQMSPVDNDRVRHDLSGISLAVTIEEHVSAGGLGGLVAEALSEEGLGTKLLRCGTGSHFVSTVGTQDFLRREVGLDAQSIVDAVCASLRSRP